MTESTTQTAVDPKMISLDDAADTWVLPDKTHSECMTQLDWNLNFQVGKWLVRKKPQMSPELRGILTQEEIETIEFQSDDQRLLVASGGFLACQNLVVRKYDGNLEVWAKDILKLLSQLKSERARVYLPKSISESDARKCFKPQTAETKITFHLDASGIQDIRI